ncbi:MAG: hypothetical protein FWF19_02680 [Euryarchaeota archaeon]|nr:hypothetical protein [Euryarchaeota archaeon]
MPRKIFVRGHQKVSDGVQQPKFRIAAIVFSEDNGSFVQAKASHFRRQELEEFAVDIHAEIVYLESEPHGEDRRRN